ncbi:MAG: hypothetical protein JO359_01480 [Candidatus Eremiobacteraeota bacterium]|nr:hypothetical protein [Candidatus Eremiobacteraeota bacterium]
MHAFMDDPTSELHDQQAAREVAAAIDAISADILKNTPQLYASGNPLHDIPHLANAMEKSIQRGKFEDARIRATTLEKYIESYSPVDEPAQEAKYLLRHRVRLLTHTED